MFSYHSKMKDSPIIFLRKVIVALLPNNFNLRTRLSNGAVLSAKNRAGFGGRGIFIYRDSIESEFEHLEKFLDSSGVFFDIGANSGMYTLKAAKHFQDDHGIVIALEPFPTMFSTLYQNVKLNKLNNIRIRNCCAGSFNGNSTLWMNNNKPNAFSLIKMDQEAKQFSSFTVTLDDLFSWEGLNRLDYIKIDVEGAEYEVIKGAKNIIEKYRPIIQMEILAKDPRIDLDKYSVFQAPNSINKIYIPNESNKIQIPSMLGWVKLGT